MRNKLIIFATAVCMLLPVCAMAANDKGKGGKDKAKPDAKELAVVKPHIEELIGIFQQRIESLDPKTQKREADSLKNCVKTLKGYLKNPKKYEEDKSEHKLIGEKWLKQKKRLVALQKNRDSLMKRCEGLRDTLSGYDMKPVLDSIATRDTLMMLISTNFLYLPYNRYAVKNIAIPAFSLISKQYAKKRSIRMELLENFENDGDEIWRFMRAAQEFRGDSRDILAMMHSDIFLAYTRYKRYDDWEATFLGGLLKSIEKKLLTSRSITGGILFTEEINILSQSDLKEPKAQEKKQDEPRQQRQELKDQLNPITPMQQEPKQPKPVIPQNIENEEFPDNTPDL